MGPVKIRRVCETLLAKSCRKSAATDEGTELLL
jgi:hypothetical protein